MKLMFAAVLVLITTSTNGQWWKPTKNELLGYGSMAISSGAFAANQWIVHHQGGKGNPFVDIKTSWKNKYKDWDQGDTRPAFPGAKTWLVWTTDAAHLTNTIDKLFLVTGTVLISIDAKTDFKSLPKNKRVLAFIVRKLLIPVAIRGVVFEVAFKNL